MKPFIQMLTAMLAMFLMAAALNFYMNSQLNGISFWIVLLLLAGDCLLYLALILSVDLSYKPIRVAWVTVILVNVVLTVFDNVGLADLIFIALNMAAGWLYIRRWRRTGLEKL